MRSHTRCMVVLVAIVVLFSLPAVVCAAGGGPPGSDHEAEEALPGYKINERVIGNLWDVMTDINKSFPKTGAVLPWTLPEGYFDFKKGLYDKYGLRFAVAYQTAYQAVSDSLSDKDTAWGGWFQLEAAWTLLNRGKDNQGTIVAALDGRHTINKSDNATPAKFYREFGSLWATDGGFLDWDPYPGILFWEQHLAKDTFAFRLGQQASEMVLDSFRFGDARTSFSGTRRRARAARRAGCWAP